MNVLEQFRIAPPDAQAELSLPFTFFDIFWMDFHPVQRLLFYEFPCSKSDFIDRIIPSVKRSLALALKHFPPFAGHFVHPSGPEMPEIQCKNGDSVSVVFAESHDDFSYFIGNQPRNADKFYPLLPELPPVIHVAGARLFPILAVQVTLFPNLGVSVGLTNHHIVGDANSTVRFIKSWASISKFGGDAEFLANKSLHPLFDRSLIKDPNRKLAEKCWNDLKTVGYNDSEPQVCPENKFRATFVMEHANIQKLKNLATSAMGHDSSDHHVSTFTVTCGYVWTCLAKSGAAIGEDDGIDNFIFAADYRSRLDPPLPPSYFGNCIGAVYAKSPRSRLISNEGFLVASKVIGEAIYKTFVCSKEEILKDVEDWPSQLRAVDWARTIGTAGSPRFDAYDADFGWGKPKKFESISIDADGSISLCRSRDSEKDLEIGLSLPKIKLDAFVTIFNDELCDLLAN